MPLNVTDFNKGLISASQAEPYDCYDTPAVHRISFFFNLTEQGAAVKSLLRYNSLLCLCHLGLVLSLRSFPHAQERGSPVSEWQASKHVCVLGVLPYEMYTRVNLSGVNGFLNVRESQGMIKERSVIHVLMITTEHAAVLTSLRSLQLVCVCVCRSSPTSIPADASMIYAPIRLALRERARQCEKGSGTLDIRRLSGL